MIKGGGVYFQLDVLFDSVYVRFHCASGALNELKSRTVKFPTLFVATVPGTDSVPFTKNVTALIVAFGLVSNLLAF